MRIDKLRGYLCDVINSLTNKENSRINADMLSKNVDNYSLDKIPTASVVMKWINGTEIRKDVFSFRSRKEYSTNEIINLQNIGFFEDFEKAINANNKKGILPEIENIQSIECLNCGALLRAETNTAIFDIQIQIVYREEA